MGGAERTAGSTGTGPKEELARECGEGRVASDKARRRAESGRRLQREMAGL